MNKKLNTDDMQLQYLKVLASYNTTLGNVVIGKSMTWAANRIEQLERQCRCCRRQYQLQDAFNIDGGDSGNVIPFRPKG